MFKLVAFLVWVLFFVVAFKIVWSAVLKPYLDNEMKEETGGIQSKKNNTKSQVKQGDKHDS